MRLFYGGNIKEEAVLKNTYYINWAAKFEIKCIPISILKYNL